ncbi:Autophagy-related protein 11 [Yarrowia sp. C11]|nr:Autophagy-related protein 11 [Yarrowia sp. E02]KAG5371508.1 Autophagy-related protein 11 [Yarrowia sp. C11]
MLRNLYTYYNTMSDIRVSSASSGESASVARDQFATLPHLKAWIELEFSVSVAEQLLLTVAAEQVKMAHLATQNELFVFDRSVVGGSVASELKYQAPKAKALGTGSDPSQWALTVLTHCSRLVEELKRVGTEIGTVKRATKVAITQMKQHSQNLDKNLVNVKEYSKELNSGISPLVGVDLVQLRDNTRSVRLVAPAVFGKKQILSDWLDLQQLQNIVVEFKTEFPSCMTKLQTLEQELTQLSKDTQTLVNSTDVWIGGTNSDVLCNEAVGVLRQLSELTNGDHMSQDAIKAVNNCQNQILDLHKALAKAKFQTVQHSQKVLQSISQLQSRSTKLKPRLTQIGVELTKYEEKRVQAMKQVDVEFVYGCVLVEMLRRTVWSQSGDNYIKSEIGTRVAWKKQFQDTFPFVDILNEQEDLNLDTISTSSPSIVHNLVIARPVVTEYISQVSSKEVRNNLESLLAGISGSAAATSSFPRSLFRNGSISGSLMAERAPISSMTNADDKTRGYEARIRKLEDLLHKQRMSQDTSRWSVSPGTPSAGFAVLSPGPLGSEGAVRGSSLSPDPVETREQIEAREKAEEAARKAEEERLQREKEAAEALQVKIDKLSQSLLHTENEKNDLMANLASMEADFSRERRCLVQEISELKLRVEELEEQVETAAEKSIERHQRADQETDELEERVKAMTLVQNNVDDENSRLKITLQDMSQRLYTGYKRNCVLLESLGLQAQKEYDSDGSEVLSFDIHRVKGLRKKHRGKKGEKTDKDSESESADDFSALYWATKTTPDSFESSYRTFLARIFLDYDLYVEKVAKRFEDLEHLARKLQKEARNYRTMTQQLDDETRSKIALNRFKVGDLVLFLPTRDPSRQPQPWAAFNVGAPHFFLKQKPGRELKERDWLVGRITGMEERVVNGGVGDRVENPFDLAQGLRWWWLEAEEE